MIIKKEFILVVIIFSLIIFFEILTNNISQKYVDELFAQSEMILNDIKHLKIQNDLNVLEKVDYNIKELKKEWIRKENILALYVEHDELEKVSKNLIALEENVVNEEYSEALECLKEFELSIKHFHEKDRVILKNVF